MLTNFCAIFFNVRFDNYNFFVLDTTSARFGLSHIFRPYYANNLLGGGGSPLLRCLFEYRNSKSALPMVLGIVGSTTNSNVGTEAVVPNPFAVLY